MKELIDSLTKKAGDEILDKKLEKNLTVRVIQY